MAVTSTTPRSIYAAKLREFPDFAFADQEAFALHGQWGDFFQKRIGPNFDGRIVLEICSFDASFLCRIAAQYPNTAFVGLDWKCKASYDGARRISAMGLRNVALIRGRGQDVSKFFFEREVDEVWVFHPDPCDRPVEMKNRLFSGPFLHDVHRILRDHASALTLKTDHAEYHRSVLDLFDASDEVRDRFDLTANSANFWQDSAAMSHTAKRQFSGEATLYESRFINKRHPIHFLELQKK